MIEICENIDNNWIIFFKLIIKNYIIQFNFIEISLYIMYFSLKKKQNNKRILFYWLIIKIMFAYLNQVYIN